MQHQKKYQSGFTFVRKDDLGFTLIELMLVIAIISVIGILAAPFYARFLTQNSVQITQDQLASEMRKAQIYSMMGKQNASWGVKYASNTITLFKTADSSFNENFSVNSNITISGFSTITFARITGLPDSTPTIIVSGNSQSKTLTINSQGVISK